MGLPHARICAVHHAVDVVELDSAIDAANDWGARTSVRHGARLSRDGGRGWWCVVVGGRRGVPCVHWPSGATPGVPHQRQHGPAAKAPISEPTGAPPPAARTSVLSAISYVDSLLKMIASLA